MGVVLLKLKVDYCGGWLLVCLFFVQMKEINPFVGQRKELHQTCNSHF